MVALRKERDIRIRTNGAFFEHRSVPVGRWVVGPFVRFSPFHIHPSDDGHHKGRSESGERSEWGSERSTKREEPRDSFVKRRTSFAFKIINSPSLSQQKREIPSGGNTLPPMIALPVCCVKEGRLIG